MTGPRVPALLHEQSFRRYWHARTVSMFGDQVSAIALPLVASLSLRASAAQMGYLTAAVWAPSLLFSVQAGAWADRRGRRRPIMIAADLGRAGLLATIPVCAALHLLTLVQLYAVAFGAGTLSAIFTVCDPALFVALAPSGRYVEGQTLVYASRAFSFLGGPSLGGLLVQVLTAPLAIMADALSFLGSAFFLAGVRPAEPPAQPRTGRTFGAGARFIAGSPVVRAVLTSAAVINFFDFVFMALFVLYVTRSLHVHPGLLGVVLGAGAVGGVIGSVLTRPIAARIGIGWAYVAGCVLFPAPLVLVPMAGGRAVLGFLFAAEFLSGFGVMMLDISSGSIFAVAIPDRLRSRVNGAFQAVNYGTRPVGALAGGALGTLIGVRPALWIGAAGALTGFLWLLPSPVPRFRMPSGPVTEPEPRQSLRPMPPTAAQRSGCSPTSARESGCHSGR